MFLSSINFSSYWISPFLCPPTSSNFEGHFQFQSRFQGISLHIQLSVNGIFNKRPDSTIQEINEIFETHNKSFFQSIFPPNFKLQWPVDKYSQSEPAVYLTVKWAKLHFCHFLMNMTRESGFEMLQEV